MKRETVLTIVLIIITALAGYSQIHSALIDARWYFLIQKGNLYQWKCLTHTYYWFFSIGTVICFVTLRMSIVSIFYSYKKEVDPLLIVYGFISTVTCFLLSELAKPHVFIGLLTLSILASGGLYIFWIFTKVFYRSLFE